MTSLSTLSGLVPQLHLTLANLHDHEKEKREILTANNHHPGSSTSLSNCHCHITTTHFLPPVLQPTILWWRNFRFSPNFFGKIPHFLFAQRTPHQPSSLVSHLSPFLHSRAHLLFSSATARLTAKQAKGKKKTPKKKKMSLLDLWRNHLWNPLGVTAFDTDSVWLPPVDVRSNEKEVFIRLEVPGVKRDDLSIELKDGHLTISGQKHLEEKSDKDVFHRMERKFGTFSRTFQTPVGLKEKDVKAKLDNGILEVSFPKTTKEQEAKKILISKL
jgi:HSP20 family protein